jgi:hypothetical protein
MRVRTAILSTVLAALSACACDTVPASAVTDCNEEIVPGTAATDILFVVDDSGSMAEEQSALSQNLSTFIDALLGAPIQLDLRVGITNTSIHGYPSGNRTDYGSGPSAGVPYPAGAVVAIEQDAQGIGIRGNFVYGFDPDSGTTTWGGARILANGADLARDFKANVLQGTWGSGKEQPLAAMKLALEKSTAGGVNFGFQRAGARLAVVILTDEDDCSSPIGSIASDAACQAPSPNLYPLSDYVTYLDSTASITQAGPPIVALIAGFDAAGATSTCRGTDPSFVPTTASAAASLPTRLDAFMDALDTSAAPVDRTFKYSICQNFGSSLVAIANAIVPQTLPLERAPADWQMIAVALNRNGSSLACPLALAGTPEAATSGAVYTPPQAGGAATLTFQNACHLGISDLIDLRIVCAR